MTTDVEVIYDKLAAKMKSVFNTKILAINTEKADFSVEAINTNAWLSGSLDDSCKSFDQFIFYFLDDLTGEANGRAVNQKCVFEFDLFFAQKEDGKDYKRFLRYARALMESAQDAWDTVGKGYDRATISLSTPIDVRLFDSSHWQKVVGIQIEFSLTN